jgi:hypothetical protein
VKIVHVHVLKAAETAFRPGARIAMLSTLSQSPLQNGILPGTRSVWRPIPEEDLSKKTRDP